VNVVGRNEIYNFHTQSFVHLYSQFWSSLRSNRGSAKPKQAGRTHARASAPRRPRRAPPNAPPTEAAASLGVRTPDVPRFSCARVSSSSRRTRAAHRVDCRSDPRAYRTHAGQDAAVPRRHLRRQHHVTTEHLFKVAFIPCARRAEPPHHCRAARHGRRHCRALMPRRSSHPITRVPSIGPLGAPSVACCPTRALHSPQSRPPRPSPPVTACAAVGCLPAQTPSTNEP
jgi:hypothetical protein